MKTTLTFKNTIQAYLDKRADKDILFAQVYTKEDKNIDDCITFILNTVQKSSCNGFTDDEIYSLAIHYYDEDNIEVGNQINANIVVNHVVELSEEEKEQAKKDAIQKYQDRTIADMKRKTEKKREKAKIIQLPTLFD